MTIQTSTCHSTRTYRVVYSKARGIGAQHLLQQALLLHVHRRSLRIRTCTYNLQRMTAIVTTNDFLRCGHGDGSSCRACQGRGATKRCQCKQTSYERSPRLHFGFDKNFDGWNNDAQLLFGFRWFLTLTNNGVVVDLLDAVRAFHDQPPSPMIV